MSADKRTVSTDALETLGMIHTRDEKRDAIHLAVIPVECGEAWIEPGADVKLRNGVAVKCARVDPDALGIVDPFLNNHAHKGQRFWLVIYPRVITSLRHVWTHPALPDEVGAGVTSSSDKAESEEWLRDYVANNSDSPFDFDDWLKIARNEPISDPEGYRWYTNDGGYLTSGGADAHGEIPYAANLWWHLERITGVPQRKRAEHFACSC